VFGGPGLGSLEKILTWDTASMPNNRLAFLVPGIFGSRLSIPRQEIWGLNFFENYSRIADTPMILAWNGSHVPATLLREANMRPPYFPFVIYRQKLWDKLITELHAHPDFGPTATIEVGYDWRASLLDLSASVSGQIKQTLRQFSDHNKVVAKAVLITHSMGGLLVRVAIGSGQISSNDIDRVIHIGTPLIGSPSAFSSLYGQLRFPLLDQFLRFAHGKRAVRFRENLFDCVHTFHSAWELLPQQFHAYVRHTGTIRLINPLTETVIDPAHVSRARQVHQLANQAEGILTNAGIPVHKIYTDSHQVLTEFQYDVSIRGIPGKSKYVIDRIYENSEGDGTVPSISASGNRPKDPNSVIDVSHAEMCNHRRVSALLPGLL
jgi:hypothetical protein